MGGGQFSSFSKNLLVKDKRGGASNPLITAAQKRAAWASGYLQSMRIDFHSLTLFELQKKMDDNPKDVDQNE